MAHELRTPMNSIIGYTVRLSKTLVDKVNERESEGLNALRRNADHLLNLINSILDLAKLDAKSMELNIEEFDITEAAGEVVFMLQDLADQKGLKLLTESPETPLMITGDNLRLKQVMVNLVSNSIKFTDTGSVKIQIKSTDTNIDQFTISIEDTGCGLSNEDLEKLFERFYQSQDNSTDKIGKGTGLGLVISSEILKLHNGTIDVTSTIGKGSCFTATLPIKYLKLDD